RTRSQTLQQRLEITLAPEMPLQSPAPLDRHIERVDQGGEEAEIAYLHLERVESRRAHRIDGELHDLDFGGGAVLETEKLGTGLVELRRAVRLRRLMAKRESVVAKPRGIGIAALDLPFAGGDREIGAQAEFAARRIGQLK